MSLNSHLAELERKHQALEQEIQKAVTSPSSSDEEIARLKRKKLVLKDQMTRLRDGDRGEETLH
ncbi:YdcH family protein [Salinarimonas chemoclinalis]|uniref:YdcH family protein n=1 Tax=Salinarimonas chemoclinalis TaxID=3241599 RepID=UPI00355694F2